jgi:hypothetical protein
VGTETIQPETLLTPRRKIRGMSAIYLPFRDSGAVDWHGFEEHVDRTRGAGLMPAVNMDTGFVDLIDAPCRREVLARARAIMGNGKFVAGIFVKDSPGAAFDLDRYRQRVEECAEAGAVPVIMQSFGLCTVPEESIADT